MRFVATESESWREAVDAYEGNDAISLLTIHRSKGLEYHTVFFLGLDDDQWWSHGKDPAASTSARNDRNLWIPGGRTFPDDDLYTNRILIKSSAPTLAGRYARAH
ncbi:MULTISPECIES: 3'-5' exonuclease, partial [Rhodococcus]